MPIDPSIISNAFANATNNMPDVNALMQQRIQGAENIYKIEAGRQEQAAQAEKEAAQQAAEAMLPAVASAFSDPSDAGFDLATSQLPPEVAQAFTPFMQRMKLIPDLNLRKSLLRAELAKDDEGRYILGQLEPTANMRLQEGTAARRAALDERRMALEEAKLNQPETMSEYEKVQSGFRERELKLKEEEIAAERAAKLEAPKIKQEAGRAKVDDTLSEMLRSYNILKQEGAIVSNEASGLENVIASTGAALGTTAGRALGTKAQTERDYIQSLRMNLISDIKAASNKSAQELNSNMELRAALDSLSDPYGQSFETALRTIAKLSRDYGKGEMAIIEPAPAGAGAAGAGAGDGTRRYDSTGKRIQ